MTDALQAVAAPMMFGAPSQPGATSTAHMDVLSERFNRLMSQEPDPSVFAAQNLHGGESQVSHFLRTQERALQGTFDEVRAFSTNAPTMDAHELAVRHIQLTYQMSMVQVQFNAGVYVAQSGKNGLQTLMKNQ